MVRVVIGGGRTPPSIPPKISFPLEVVYPISVCGSDADEEHYHIVSYVSSVPLKGMVRLQNLSFRSFGPDSNIAKLLKGVSVTRRSLANLLELPLDTLSALDLFLVVVVNEDLSVAESYYLHPPAPRKEVPSDAISQGKVRFGVAGLLRSLQG